MDIKHTATPWRTKESGLDFYIQGDAIRKGRRENICTIPSDFKRGAANAEFIVRAVNSHEALVKALDDCVNAMYADNPADGWLEIIQAGRAALAQARGESPTSEPGDRS